VLTRDERDLTRLTDAFRPKVLAEDVVGYEREITRDPASVALHDSAALLYLELGDPGKALDHFARSVQLRPDSAAAQFNVGTAQSLNGQLAEAEASLVRALALRPDYPQAHNNLGGLLLQRGDRQAAAEHFREALRLDPLGPEAHRNLAVIHRDTGNPAAAIAELRQALTLRPDWPAAMADLAWLLATTSQTPLRDPRQAIGLAERIVAMTGQRDAAALDVLAAAYAAAGDFERAIQAAELALPLATSATAGEAIRGRIALYRRRTPFIDR
jgi:tetratricopeptide (TPR) repeat protein